MDPIAALRRVSYLMDRGRLDSRRSEAFLKAASALEAVDADERAKRIANHTVSYLPGIGPSTAAVIEQAAAGKVPDRIVELEELTQVPLGDGTELRTLLRGDCHSHTVASDGGADIPTMADAARALGHEYLVITDHSPRLRIANGLDRERLEAQVDQIQELNEQFAPFRILTGIEVDINLDGTLDQDEDLLDRLDIVVASVHSKLQMESRAMTRRMITAVSNPLVDILGHCTGRRVEPMALGPREIRPQSQFDAEAVFTACRDSDTAVEINCRPERQDPPDDLLTAAVELDCRFSIDTDSHAPGQLEFLNYGADKAFRHRIEAGRIVTTWPLERLLAWSHQR